MSFDGHVLCHRKLIGPCALTTVGAARVATPAASRNRLRVEELDADVLLFASMSPLPNVQRLHRSPIRARSSVHYRYSSARWRKFDQTPTGSTIPPLVEPSDLRQFVSHPKGLGQAHGSGTRAVPALARKEKGGSSGRSRRPQERVENVGYFRFER